MGKKGMSVAVKQRAWNVFLCDVSSKAAIPRSPVFKVLNRPEPNKVRDLFVFCSAVQLPEVASLVSTVNRRNQLRMLFVRGQDPAWLPQMLERAKLRTIRNLVVHSDVEMPKRILNAWKNKAQDKLVARAMVVKDRLFLTSCEPEILDIGFDELPALKSIPETERASFEVAEDGSYIHWPSVDIHLDLDSVRSVLDPDFRDQRAAQRVKHDVNFGKAIASLRKEQGLRQSDIAGLSERQLRRIERGATASVSALRSLAASHDLNLNDYLNAVAKSGRAVGR
jgi:hypothetical protein